MRKASNMSTDGPDAATALAADSSRQWAEIARLLTHSQRCLQRLTCELEPSESEWVLLWVCSEAPTEGMAQVAFAGALGVSPAQVSVNVERLREQGWLESNRCANDRRRRLWRLTDAGRQVLKQAGRELTERLSALEFEVSVEELNAVRTLLGKLISSLNSSSGRKERAA